MCILNVDLTKELKPNIVSLDQSLSSSGVTSWKRNLNGLEVDQFISDILRLDRLRFNGMVINRFIAGRWRCTRLRSGKLRLNWLGVNGLGYNELSYTILSSLKLTDVTTSIGRRNLYLELRRLVMLSVSVASGLRSKK